MSLKSPPHHQGEASLNFEKDENQNQKMTIAPKDLSIVWGADERYWNVPKDKHEPAELYQVSWLEVTGCVDQTDPMKKYEVGFQLSLNTDAFGWGNFPVYVLAKRGKKGKFSRNKIVLEHSTEIKVKLNAVKEPSEDPSEDRKVYFGLYEVWSGKWKGGLKINKAFIEELQ